MPPKTSSAFWQFNIGHLLTLITMFVGGLTVFTTFVHSYDGHDARITALERAESLQAALPSRVTVLETRFDVLQAQLTQLNLTSNRTADAVSSMREDLATIRATLAGRGN